jgi:hypothetical protein
MLNFISGLLVGLLGVAGTLGAAYYTFVGHSQDLDVKMVEIAIGILRAPPADNSPMREWAIQVINGKSGFPFTEQQKAVLLKKELDIGGLFWGKKGEKVWVLPGDTYMSKPPEEQPKFPK